MEADMAARPGLYANTHAKRKRIAEGSGEQMRKVGSEDGIRGMACIDDVLRSTESEQKWNPFIVEK